MRLKEIKCFGRSDMKDQDFSIRYIQSEFKGQYLAVYEDVGYSLDVKYVSDPKIIKQLNKRFEVKNENKPL